MKILNILKTKDENQEINGFGWVVSNRGNDKVRFLILNDGSCFKNLQIVVKGQEAEKNNRVKIGTPVKFSGKIKLTAESKQEMELTNSKVEILKNIDDDYPLQNQEISKETLREIPHMRARTQLFKSIMKVRSSLLLSVHEFFDNENFTNVSAPIITGNDGEGAGEVFVVDSEEGGFFNKKATLGVTGQLHAESYANCFGDVYTFAPTFRAENSNTVKHAAEFWMIEPEMAFTDINGGIEIADKLLKFVIKKTLTKHPEEFDFFEKVKPGLKQKLNLFLNKKIEQITYSEAIKKLMEVKDQFKFQDIKFGIDLATEHERYIAEELFKGPVAVTNYPKEIKAFYMKQNSDNKTVSAFDILVPGIGELVGGSQRECDYKKLVTKVEEMGIDQKDLQWYLDLRRWGQFMSTGFGVGFERLIMYVTGVENIRDTIPYPRTPKNLKM